MKVFAFYLPQFHPCDANNEFWEDGFTDWVTTYSAKPLFNGHNQPINSTTLGKYDLTDPCVIKKQAELAKEHGIDGFAIYHYWFDENKRALEKPIEIIRKNKNIDIEYYISWVNCNWTKSWVGEDRIVIREQKYSFELFNVLIEDSIKHFQDERYLKINGNPVFYIHSPKDFDVNKFILLMKEKALNAGFNNVSFIAPEIHVKDEQKSLFDRLISYPPGDYWSKKDRNKIKLWNYTTSKIPSLRNSSFMFKYLKNIDYSKYVNNYFVHIESKINKNFIPTIMQSWDNTPRYKYNGFVFKNATPENNYELYKKILKLSSDVGCDFILLKAWNEWAEGNVLEPDNVYGRKRLKAFSRAKSEL